MTANPAERARGWIAVAGSRITAGWADVAERVVRELPSVKWLVVLGLSYRALLTPVSAVAGLGAADTIPDQASLAVAASLAALNIWYIFCIVALGRWSLVGSKTFLTFDIAIAVGVNLWHAASAPTDSILASDREIFWQYLLGTVVAWTSIYGWRVGAALACASAVTQSLMVAANGVRMSLAGAFHVFDRIGWIGAAVLVPAVIVKVVRTAETRGRQEGYREVRAARRAAHLRDIHDTVKQALAQIVTRAASSSDVGTRLAECRGIAVRELGKISEGLVASARPQTGDLQWRLANIARQFADEGLDVYITVSGIPKEPPAAIAGAVIGATREALTNIRKHAQVAFADVGVQYEGETVQVLVIDHGVGFRVEEARGFGLPRSIVDRIQETGGTAEVLSTVGRGTVVSIRVPTELSPAVSAKFDGVGWLALPALAYRVCLFPLQLALAVATLNSNAPRVFWLALVAVLAVDVVILAGVARGKLAKLLSSGYFFALDVGVALALNVWQALLIGLPAVFVPGAQFLWGYLYGAIILWTAVRGALAGAAVACCGIALEALLWIARPGVHSWESMLEPMAQMLKLLVALAISTIVIMLSRRSSQRAVMAGMDAGRVVERADELHRLQAESLSVLNKIWESCYSTGDERVDLEIVRQIRGVALLQLDEIESVMTAEELGDEPDDPLSRALRTFARRWKAVGVRVELFVDVDAVGQSGPVLQTINSVLDCIQDGLILAARPSHVVLSAFSGDGALEVVVRARGTSSVLEDLAIAPDPARSLVLHAGGTLESFLDPDCHGARVVFSIQRASH